METLTEQVEVADERAEFAGFFAEHFAPVLRAMYLVTGDRFEAEELAQVAFVKVYERWDRVARMDNPVGYVYRAAVNAHRKRLRRLATAARRTLSLLPVDEISGSDERDEIRRMLARLSDSQREALVLIEWLGFSDAEAGAVLGISAGAVRVRLSRAKAALRQGNEGGVTP
jgi:RNA polymerase sigma factor (sigma-70 family)